ncbi:LuxR C-terminal-related transcriptional regulator [Nonomuraea polychroma]|jgi:DNA-binding NarL/FixJ family response regulator|uniref:response regulator transcription factor n=1 Tax=Nonomuraea polychroma TaxID=46176 RepID=UPI003D8B4A10
MERVAVMVHAHDPLLRAGLVSQLRARPEVRLLDRDDTGEAAVVVLAADMVSEPVMVDLRRLRSHGARLLAVIGHIGDADLLSVVEVGVAGVLRRAEATPERLVATIQAAAAGDGSMPPDLLGKLLSQVQMVQRDLLDPRGLRFTGLADREIEVLRLVADGYDTAQIAATLCYSQRTVKSVLHDVMSRLHLRNRPHAVAYALRNGLL